MLMAAQGRKHEVLVRGGFGIPQRLACGSAIAALTASALQRRATTGGPIFTENAPWALRQASIGFSHCSRSGVAQSMTALQADMPGTA